MYGLSIDPNTKQSGVVAWKDGKPIWHDTKTPADPRTMAGTLWFMIYSRCPDWVAIENVYEGPNAQTTIKLAKLIGALEEWCKDANIPVYVLSTAEIDKACDIWFNPATSTRKEHTMALARLELGDEITQDVADAYCVGVAALGEQIKAGWAAQESEES